MKGKENLYSCFIYFLLRSSKLYAPKVLSSSRPAGA